MKNLLTILLFLTSFLANSQTFNITNWIRSANSQDGRLDTLRFISWPGYDVSYSDQTLTNNIDSIGIYVLDFNTPASIDNLLIDIAATGSIDGTLSVVDYTVERTSASDAAVSTLLGNGWTINLLPTAGNVILTIQEQDDGDYLVIPILSRPELLTGSPLVTGSGSSTLNRTGATVSDSSVAGRYEAWLAANTTGGQFAELATNGWRTDMVFPDSLATVDTRPHENATALSSLNPDIALIMFPSNDMDDGNNTPQQYYDNLIAIKQEYEKKGVFVFIQDAQPRTAFNATERQRIYDGAALVRADNPELPIENVMQTFLPLEDAGSGVAIIDAAYDSGDGVHPNDLGHRLIFDTLISVLTNYFQLEHFDRIEIERSTSSTSGFSVIVSNASELGETQSRIDDSRYFYRARIRFTDMTYSAYSNVVSIEQPVYIGAVDQTIQVNFTDAATAVSGWNIWNVTNPVATASITNLLNTSDVATGVDITLIDNGLINDTGVTGGGTYPDLVIGTSWEIDGNDDTTPKLEITDLSSAHSYNITVISSEVTAQPDRRTAVYNLENNKVASVNSGNNDGSEVLTLNGLIPDGTGKLTLDLRAVWYGQGFINGLIIERRENTSISTITRVPINTRNSNPDGYVEYLPVGYDASNDWPVLVAFHGLGEAGDGSDGDLVSLQSWAVMGWLASNDVGFVVLAPQDFNGYFSGDPNRADTFVAWARTEYSSKTNQYSWHASYASASGAGFDDWANENSSTFQAMASHTPGSALTGNGTSTEWTNMSNSSASVWFHHQNVDATVGYGQTETWYEGLIGVTGVDYDKYRYTLYDETGHSGWTKTYDDSGISDPQVTGAINGTVNYYEWTTGSWWDWLLAQSKLDVTAPVATFSPVNSAIDVSITGNITITYDEVVYQPDGSAIDQTWIEANYELKETNDAGSSHAYTGSVSTVGGYSTITLNPDTDLSNSQVYYVEAPIVEDAQGNENTSTNVTWTTASSSTPTILARVNFTRASQLQAGTGWINWGNNDNTPTVGDPDASTGTTTLSITDDFLGTSTTDILPPSPNGTDFPDEVWDASWHDRYGGIFTISGTDISDAETYNIYFAEASYRTTQNRLNIYINSTLVYTNLTQEDGGTSVSTTIDWNGGSPTPASVSNASSNVVTVNNVTSVSNVITIEVEGEDPFSEAVFGHLCGLIIEVN